MMPMWHFPFTKIEDLAGVPGPSGSLQLKKSDLDSGTLFYFCLDNLSEKLTLAEAAAAAWASCSETCCETMLLGGRRGGGVACGGAGPFRRSGGDSLPLPPTPPPD